MTWTPYSKADPLPPPPRGFERARIRSGDTLGDVADESGVSAEDIAAANGVPPHHRSKPTCAWEQDLAAMLLASGGQRMPFRADQPNACEPGLGFPAFSTGQVLNLPTGLRDAVVGGFTVKAEPKGMSTGAKAAIAGVLALLVAGAVKGATKHRTRKAAAAAA